VWFGSTG